MTEKRTDLWHIITLYATSSYSSTNSFIEKEKFFQLLQNLRRKRIIKIVPIDSFYLRGHQTDVIQHINM